MNYEMFERAAGRFGDFAKQVQMLKAIQNYFDKDEILEFYIQGYQEIEEDNLELISFIFTKEKLNIIKLADSKKNRLHVRSLNLKDIKSINILFPERTQQEECRLEFEFDDNEQFNFDSDTDSKYVKGFQVAYRDSIISVWKFLQKHS